MQEHQSTHVKVFNLLHYCVHVEELIGSSAFLTETFWALIIPEGF